MEVAHAAEPLLSTRGDYVAAETPRLVTLEPARFLAKVGKGEPGGAAFQADVAALFAVAGELARRGVATEPGFLEALWWTPDVTRGTFTWELLLRLADAAPGRIALAEAAAAVAEATPLAREVRIQELAEGECLQTLHRGAYDAVGPAVARLEAAAQEEGRRLAPPIHEIYLNGPPTPPDAFLTIVRHPLAPLEH
ncbi:GyrI-like domain-containing protein [Anaeromyxobacter terrae]|uniref:GyrI-like domain-containing protein n=1 Tax=Anaeromyxobacter terrae TaxID=2925406 RepID=UPI001F5809FF|nr:GyrI-like domain-containing protein [Anaeromyxobacter sp. SG22]